MSHSHSVLVYLRVPCLVVVSLCSFFLASSSSRSASAYHKATPALATIHGVVQDALGGVLPGVSVTLEGESLIASKTTTTDTSGRFVFRELVNGRYRLQAVLAGFGLHVRELDVIEDGDIQLTIELAVSAIEETIIVTGQSPRIDTKYSTVSSTYSSSQEVEWLSEATASHSQWRYNDTFNTDAYDSIVENSFQSVYDYPLSTFAVDVDTGSYSTTRSFLSEGELPPRTSVRLEELLNYFDYDYAPPKDKRPFSVHFEAAGSPWSPKHRLIRIGLKGRVVENEERPAGNYVFLLDVSGSMNAANKLPLVRRSMRLLVRQLNPEDRVAIVVYAGASGLVLPSTSGENDSEILDALARLKAGGSTNGGDGIRLAYQVASENFIEDGVNRVILATDGDFNVGTTSQADLLQLIEGEAKRGVFLTVLGFGMGNYKDSTLEKLADHGNGHYAYIDNDMEARKLFVQQINATLVTIAKDVKIQVEFNPRLVVAYRLLGYENRLLKDEEFNDDTKDAGDIGAGHTVTALYEVVPRGKDIDLPPVDGLKYQQERELSRRARSRELLTVKLRYKRPDGRKSRLLERSFSDGGESLDEASTDFRFAAAVAGYGLLLRRSVHRAGASWERIRELAQGSLGKDPYGYRAEFLELITKAEKLELEVRWSASR